ncbi:MAG: helix-turn-helix domain-containing protein [Kofleriaceae bacterium]
MPRKVADPLPVVARVLSELGDHVRLARQRRRLPAELVAERAGMSRPTLRALERGASSVTLGALANVLHVLGLEKELGAIGRDDPFGRKLEDARLEARPRVPVPRRKRAEG